MAEMTISDTTQAHSKFNSLIPLPPADKFRTGNNDPVHKLPVELCEPVICDLPIREVLNARFVSPAWMHFIATNDLVQKGCFLKPRIKDEKPLASTGIWIVQEQLYRGQCLSENCLTNGFHGFTMPYKVVNPEVTPLMVYNITSFNNKCTPVHLLNPLIPIIAELINEECFELAEMFCKRILDLKWTEMSVTQPPTTSLEFKSLGLGGPASGFTDLDGGSRIDNPNGVTIWDFVMWVVRYKKSAREKGLKCGNRGWFPVYAGVLKTK